MDINPKVLEKYQRFVADYNSGMDRSLLEGKYRIPPDKFDGFIEFLGRKGYQLERPQQLQRMAHEIDFAIHGEEMQFIEVELDPGETALAEVGAMMYMDEWIDMVTIFGDGSSESQSVMGKVFGAGKRVLTGENLFMTSYTNRGNGKQKVAFGAPFPGSIVPMDLGSVGGELICQKDSFLCAAKGVEIGIAFQKRLGAAFFGGEGFILQRLTGDGLVFVHAGGALMERELKSGEVLKVDTGCMVAMQKSVDYDIEFVGGVKNALFGGEGFFFATLRGPGKVWLQSLPLSRLAERVLAAAPMRQTGGGEKSGEQFIGGIIGNILSGR